MESIKKAVSLQCHSEKRRLLEPSKVESNSAEACPEHIEGNPVEDP